MTNGDQVTAKRAGFNEQLTDEQLLDMDEYEHDDDDLSGQLEIVHATNGMTVYLVDGQEAEKSTIKPVDL